jgi:signal transduction histidine kinase
VFNRVRLSLTAWYIAVLLGIVLVVAGIIYIMLSRALEDEVDDSLRASAVSIASQVDEGSLEGVGGEGDDDHESEDEGEFHFFTEGSGDTFYFVLSPDGSTLLNPSNVHLDGVPSASAASAALDSGEDWATIDAGGADYRLYSLAIRDEEREIAVVQVGRSLAEHRRQLNSVLLVLAIAGGSGLVLAGAGGLLVAGRALRPVRQAFDRQRAFVSDSSHELRTPLTVIRGNAEMVRLSAGDALSAEDQRSLSGIVEEAQYMEHLLSDLSRLASLDEGRTPLHVEAVPLGPLLESMAEAARSLGQEKSLTVAVEGADSPAAGADPVRLREVLMALVENAVRYAPDGGRITLRAEPEGHGARITVTDSGAGIAPEDVERIFDRFYRADEARSRDAGGSGLGLAIARAIARAHGGTLTADNPPEGGARFTLRLPGPRS